ncbi:MAG: hypothetical protein NTY53_11600 [Kiritimatiellaeota bacterium]|nr:hypothetical protein [Kiritimatiellota bacterium]
MAAAVLLLLGFYSLTNPRNHSEANDAFNYALTVERPPGEHLWHSQHLLYFPTAKLLFGAAQKAGLADRAYPVMLFFSRVCGALAVLIAFLLLRRRGLAMPAALAGAVGLALAYGFWRYSNEAEIYAPAILLILLAWLAATGAPKLANVMIGAILAALACLMHLLNILPALAALPLFYLLQRRIRDAVRHVLLAGAVTGAVYLAIFGSQVVTEIFSAGPDQPEGGLHAASLAKGAVALTQNITAGNFLFASEKFQHALTELFPYRALERQIFTGQHADALSSTVPYVTLALLLLAGVALLVARRRVPPSAPDAAFKISVGVWFALYAAVVLVTEPGGPENWVMALPPLMLLVAATLFAPLAAAGRVALPLAFVALLGLHNYFGAFRLLADEEGDLAARKSAWFIQNATGTDLILTADTFETVRYLAYYGHSDIIHLIYGVNESTEPQFLADLKNDRGRVFATADVFDLPASLQRRFPRRAEFLKKLGHELAPAFAPVATNEFGVIFVLRPELMR